jgi:photosystem II stability/assembly factor-like uncharacterized protein
MSPGWHLKVGEKREQVQRVQNHGRPSSPTAHTRIQSMNPNLHPTSYLCVAFASFLIAGCSSSLPALHWEATGGPYAQNIVALTIDQENPRLLYAGLATGEIFKSPDRGRTWIRSSVVRKNHAIYRLVLHPELKTRMYAATDTGFFVSTNRGKDWIGEPIDKDGRLPTRGVCVDPFKGNLVYAGVQGRGVYKSTDSGTSWTKCELGLDAQRLANATVNDITIELLHPDVVYAALSGIGLVKSTNGGDSWTLLAESVTYPGTNITTIVVHRKEEGTLCIGMDDGSIYKSTNGGTSWALSRRGQSRAGVLSLVAHPSNPEIIYAGTGSGALVSSDFGISWRGVSPDLPRTATSIVVSSESPVPRLYAFGQGVGLQCSSDNGRTWQRADSLLGGSTVSSLVSDKSGAKVFCVVGSAVYEYLKESSSWGSACNGLTGGTISSVAFDIDSASILYAGTSDGLYRTVNGGKLWEPIAEDMRFSPIQFFDTHPSIRTRMYASTERSLQVSTDKGSTWAYTKPNDASYRIQSLTFSPWDAGRVYGATLNKGVVASDDGGITWKEVGYWPAESAINAVTLDPRDQKTVYVWTMRGDAFRSTDNGTFWNRYVPPWKPGDTVCVSFDRDAPSNVIALVNGRQLFYTQGGGATWFDVPIMPLPDEMRSLCWNQKTSMVYAGARQGGVYQISLRESLDKLVGK